MAASTDSELPDSDYTSPITTMYGSYSPWNAPEFPLIKPTGDHAVLYQIPTDESSGPPAPVAGGQDKWDSHHVKMPTSDKSYGDNKVMVLTSSEKRWKIVDNALKKPIKDSHDLAKAILSYNTKFANTWKFGSMHKFFNQYWEQRESKEFFKNTLPSIARLALNLPSFIQAPIPMLKKEMNKTISLSQLQISCLLANAFFCTFPRRNTTGPGSEYGEYPRINFIDLYESDSDGIMEKLKCICHYFKRVCSDMPLGVMTFSRRHLKTSSCPNWERSQVPIGSTPLHVDQNVNIEDAEGTIQVIFSNKFLGGGVLGSSLLQQEIRFLICPELMASMLFTEVLGPNDALMIIGCERYSRYTGNDRVNFRWAGDFRDVTPIDSSGRKRCAVLAIDAQNFHDERRQYQRDMIFRELNKAYIGVSFFTDQSSPGLQYPGVATGNWGCGAFNGSPQLKALIQLMACAQARRPIAYLTFKDASLKDEVIKVFNMLKRHEVTVGGLFNLITGYQKTDLRLDLHKYVKVQLEKRNMPPANTLSGLFGLFGIQKNTSYQRSFRQYPANPPAYSSSSYVPPNAGRGYKDRQPAPKYTAPRPENPPAVSPSPSYSVIYDRQTPPRPYRSSYQYRSLNNSAKPPAYSFSSHVSHAGRGYRNRSSALKQNEPRQDNPQAVSPSPSYSDVYDPPGGKLASFYGSSKYRTVDTGALAKEKSQATTNTAKAQPSTAMEGPPPSAAPDILNAPGSQQMPIDPPAYDSSSASARARTLAVQAQYARKIAEIEKAAMEAELRAAVAAIDAEESDTPVA